MIETLKNLKSFEAIKFFKEMNEIPRGSGNEKAVSDWLVKFAKDRNLEVIQDEALNVIIKKPATSGYENAPTVILQGHMDMVCEKNQGTEHDFEKDPIEFIIDGDFIKANGTTLGADNGIAVAYALAILDNKTTAHPPIEVLITTEEEIETDNNNNSQDYPHQDIFYKISLFWLFVVIHIFLIFCLFIIRKAKNLLLSITGNKGYRLVNNSYT